MSQTQPPFASGLLDRDAATRTSLQQLQDAWAEPGARLLRLRGVEIPVAQSEGGGLALALWPTTGDFTLMSTDSAVGHVYLGRMDGAPVFAVGVAADDDTETPGETWRHPFEVGSGLSDLECEAIVVASALLRWHEAAEFSPRDGEKTVAELGGWARREARGGELFPRTDPAVIVLVEHNDQILLGSNALWETGRFSLLAGFVEAGESLEQTVSREIFEEAGVRLTDITYVASQPWPFPRSLMVGFRARLADGADPLDLTPDAEEISELRWFTRAELRNPGPDIRLPMPMSIARWLIDIWVGEGDSDGGGQ